NKALKIYEDAGDLYRAAGEYHQLGVVAQLQRRFEEAISWYTRALSIFRQAKDEYKAGFPLRQLAQLFQTLGPAPFKTTWQTATGAPCPAELLQALAEMENLKDSET
ncbi:MAG: tetratricopeptide repeat protein, partial [Synechococcales cyanobacterium RM1_1_8]|nr:tetratricopeptide repeat protein [Synechococcales cyanobacterium RM1_1_8]